MSCRGECTGLQGTYRHVAKCVDGPGVFPGLPSPAVAVRELVQRLDRAEANPKVAALDLSAFDAIDLVDAILYLCDQATLSTEQVTAIRRIIEAAQ